MINLSKYQSCLNDNRIRPISPWQRCVRANGIFPHLTLLSCVSPSLAAPFSRLCILVSGPLSPMTQHSTGPEQPEQGRCGRRLAFGIKGNLKQFGLPVSAVSSLCVRTQSHSRQCHLVVLVKIRPWKIRDIHCLSLVTDIPSFYVFTL